MAKATLTASDSILRVLKRGPQKGLTAAIIAERSGLRLSTVRSTIYDLKSAGAIAVVGQEDPTMGRPAYRYALAG